MSLPASAYRSAVTDKMLLLARNIGFCVQLFLITMQKKKKGNLGHLSNSIPLIVKYELLLLNVFYKHGFYFFLHLTSK